MILIDGLRIIIFFLFFKKIYKQNEIKFKKIINNIFLKLNYYIIYFIRLKNYLISFIYLFLYYFYFKLYF